MIDSGNSTSVKVSKMKLNTGITVFLESLLVMPIITMISLLFLQTKLFEMQDILNLDYTLVTESFTREILIFIVAWVALFIEFVVHTFSLRGAKLYWVNIVLAVCSFIFGIVCMIIPFTEYASVAHIICPLITAVAGVVSVINLTQTKPVHVKVTDNEVRYEIQRNDKDRKVVEEVKEEKATSKKNTSTKRGTSTKKNYKNTSKKKS